MLTHKLDLNTNVYEAAAAPVLKVPPNAPPVPAIRCFQVEFAPLSRLCVTLGKLANLSQS